MMIIIIITFWTLIDRVQVHTLFGPLYSKIGRPDTFMNVRITKYCYLHNPKTIYEVTVSMCFRVQLTDWLCDCPRLIKLHNDKENNSNNYNDNNNNNNNNNYDNDKNRGKIYIEMNSKISHLTCKSKTFSFNNKTNSNKYDKIIRIPNILVFISLRLSSNKV